jgi:hypothetical protein
MDESISVCSNEAVEVGGEDENAVCDSLSGCDVSQMKESFMSLESHGEASHCFSESTLLPIFC